MSTRLPVNYSGEFCYDIYIKDSFDELLPEVKKVVPNKDRKICIVTETNVGPIYAEELVDELKNFYNNIHVFEFEAGEKSKNLDTVKTLYKFLIEKKFDRNDILIALGGGVVGDLTGFTAATYLRGIKFIQIPTSLLAQVDSSIGGKTGVDFDGYKNMVGAFKQPKLVYINISTLDSLPEREYLSGMGEVIKYGFIKNRNFLVWLDEHVQDVISHDKESLQKMIYESCSCKKKVVEYDPEERLGERALLNFGHTLGHAIEKQSMFALLHGECVALGMITALKISANKTYISKDDAEFGIDVIRKYHLPLTVYNLSKDKIVDTTALDKKMDSGVIHFVLLDQLGNAYTDLKVSKQDMYDSLNDIVL